MYFQEKILQPAKYHKNAIKAALLVCLAGILFTLTLAALEKNRFHGVLYKQTLEQLSKIRANIESEVNANFYLTRGMVAYVAANPNIEQKTFHHIAKILLRHKSYITNIVLAPDNVVSFVYPEQGNEKVIGLDYQQNKQQWPAVEKMMETGKSLVAGPVNLVQGGSSFICRSPIYILALDRDYGDDVYWGLTSIVIDQASLFKDAGFYSQDKGIRVAMRGVDGTGEKGAYIAGDHDVFQEKPVFLSVHIPGGSWQLAAVPDRGWKTSSPYLVWICALGILLTLAVGFLCFLWMQGREQAQRSIHAALAKAEKANLAKSAFLANMSHEIRTPMNSIIGRTHLALDGHLDQETEAHLEMISHSSENLLALINDILDFSKIEAGELNLENRPFELRETVESCLKTIKVLLEDKDKSVRLSSFIATDVPEMVTGDALRLRQVLLNLLSNSAKFTEDGVISLAVACLQANDDSLQLEFKVKDSGIGIAEDKLDHIFGKFAQEDDSSTRRYGGTGLGLAICRELCHLMGGDIQVDSVPIHGSTFTFTVSFQPCGSGELPVSRITEPNQEEKKPALSTLPSLSLLLVEDNEPNRILARMVLEKNKHQVTEAHDGLQALTSINTQDFDAVLMDVQMPIMDGLTATRIIRAAEQGEQIEGVEERLAMMLGRRLHGRHIPVIAMTANAMAGDREECLAAGMDDYLTKPFNPKAFATVLRKLATDQLLVKRDKAQSEERPVTPQNGVTG